MVTDDAERVIAAHHDAGIEALNEEIASIRWRLDYRGPNRPTVTPQAREDRLEYWRILRELEAERDSINALAAERGGAAAS